MTEDQQNFLLLHAYMADGARLGLLLCGVEGVGRGMSDMWVSKARLHGRWRQVGVVVVWSGGCRQGHE
jgi:hypothetical protein